MAEENVSAHAPTRSDEPILPFKAWLLVGKGNLILDLHKLQKNPIFRISVDILPNTNFFRAFTVSANVPTIYIQQFWNTLTQEVKYGVYNFQLDEQWFTLNADLLRKALEITLVDSAHTFVPPPASEQVMDFVNELGYPEEIHFVSKMHVNNLYQPWRAIMSLINQCLTGKTSGNDKPRHHVLQMLWGIVIITNVDYAELLRPGSPVHVTGDDFPLGNLKFVPKGKKDEVFGMPIPKELITKAIQNSAYYQQYLEMVARKPTTKEGRQKKTAFEASKPKKPTPVKKPAPTKQTKPVKEKSTKPAPSMKANKGIQMSLESFQAPFGGVAIREPASGVTRSLPVVEGKGKGTTTNEEAAQSLLELQQPKKKNAETGADTKNSNSEGDTRGDNMSNTVALEERTVGLDEGQARSDPGNTLESRPPPDEDQHTTEEHVHIENPLSSSGTLSSMKNLDDAFTFCDQFLNDKPTEEETSKANVETEVESMVTVSIHQASSSASPLSTPIIDLTHPKPVSLPAQEPVFTAATTAIIATTTKPLLPPPPPQQQSTTDPELANCVSALEEICANLAKKNKLQDQTTQALSSRIFTLENHDLYSKIDNYINETVKEAVQNTLQAQPEHTALCEALEASMDRKNREEFVKATTKSHKRHRDDQDPPLPPLKDSDQNKKKMHDSDTSASKQSQAQTSLSWKTSDTREAPSSSSKQNTAPQSKLPVDDFPITDDAHISDTEDNDANHLPKIKTIPDWLKHPKEKKLIRKTRDMGSFIKWYCKQIGKSKLNKADLEGPAFKIDLIYPEGNLVVPDVSKPLPLGGPPGQVTIQQQYFFNKDVEYLISGDKDRRNALSISKLKVAYYPSFGLEELVSSLWIESEREYDISAAYGILHWWFKCKKFYITRHIAPSDCRTVRSHMKILSVISLKTFSRYGYTFLREIVLRRADYKEYKILEADFKNLHMNDFEDLCLLHLQVNLNHLSGADKVHLFNAINLWIRNTVIRKQDYTIVHKPRAIIYRDRNNQKKMMRESEVHKFSDGKLTRILEKLDHMVKDFMLFKFNPGMENRIWSEDDKRRSKAFIEVIERRLKIKRIFRNMQIFVSGRLRDVDYKLIQRTDDFIIPTLSFDTRPPMLDRTDFEYWQQHIRLYCLGKDNGVNILKLINEGPFKMGKFRETLAEGALHLGPERDRVFAALTPEEKEMFIADICATNILLQDAPRRF
ncbi:hypothetical protein Tco_0778022 [Tanacetum coccineum]